MSVPIRRLQLSALAAALLLAACAETPNQPAPAHVPTTPGYWDSTWWGYYGPYPYPWYGPYDWYYSPYLPLYPVLPPPPVLRPPQPMPPVVGPPVRKPPHAPGLVPRMTTPRLPPTGPMRRPPER